MPAEPVGRRFGEAEREVEVRARGLHVVRLADLVEHGVVVVHFRLGARVFRSRAFGAAHAHLVEVFAVLLDRLFGDDVQLDAAAQLEIRLAHVVADEIFRREQILFGGEQLGDRLRELRLGLAEVPQQQVHRERDLVAAVRTEAARGRRVLRLARVGGGALHGRQIVDADVLHGEPRENDLLARLEDLRVRDERDVFEIRKRKRHAVRVAELGEGNGALALQPVFGLLRLARVLDRRARREREHRGNGKRKECSGKFHGRKNFW